MEKQEKKFIRVHITTIECDLKNKVEKVIEKLKDELDYYKGSYNNVEIDDYWGGGDYYGNNTVKILSLFGERLETDKEFELRIKNEEKYSKEREERDKIEFERLKEK